MPNWCKGNIRFRGTQENIKRFLMNEIVCCKYTHETGTVEEKPTIDDKDFILTIDKPEHSWFYIKGTRRNFFETDHIEVWFDEEDTEKETIICVDNYEVAWSFSENDAWKEIAKKYCLDVRMTGYERGMQFSQVRTYYRDGISVTDEVKKYASSEDWMWNCPMPNFGG